MSDRFQPVAVFLIAVTALGQAGAGASAAVVDVRAVLLSSSSPTDTTNVLPTSLTAVQPGRSVVLEVWAQNAAPPLTGLACVFVDVEFDASVFQVVAAPTVGSTFGLLAQSGAVNNRLGRISDVGGCIQLGDSGVGVAPDWVLVARSPLVVSNEAAGIAGILVGPTGLAALGVSLVGGGSVSNSAIGFGGVSVVVGLPGDLDGDGVPVVLSRTPAPDSVVNRTVGVTRIGVRFDRPILVEVRAKGFLVHAWPMAPRAERGADLGAFEVGKLGRAEIRLAETLADRLGPFEQPVGLDRFDRRQTGSAGDRIAAERRGMHAGL